MCSATSRALRGDMRTHLATARTSCVSTALTGQPRERFVGPRAAFRPEFSSQTGRVAYSLGPLDLRLTVARVAAEHPRGRELAELVADHLLADEDGHVLAAVVDRDRVPNHLREDRRRPRPGADHLLAAGLVHPRDAAHQPLLDERALFTGSTQPVPPFLRAQRSPNQHPGKCAAFFRQSSLVLTSPSRADDQLVGFLVLAARALAERRHAPGRHRMAAALRLALAATVRMVDGVHRGAADGRALAAPAATAGLAVGDVLVVDIADLADGRPARQRNAAHLARGKAQDAVTLILRDQLDARARRARHLAALAGLQLDVVDERAGRDVRQRQGVAGLDVGAWARLDDRADPQSRGGEDVRLRAVGVMEQRDPGRPVRVVLDRGHLRRDGVLDALEVDLAVLALVAASLVTAGDATVHVSPTALLERLGEALLGLGLRDLVERRDRHEAPTRARGLVAADGHGYACAPSKISIDSPALIWTIAFFQPGFRPLTRPRRFGLERTWMTFTRSTWTSNSSSTAWRICVLCASGWTRNE